MPKLVSVKQQEGHDARATAYIKACMLFPAGILGLISMLGGVGGLGYQLIATDTYSWTTFLESSGLLLLGECWGGCRPRTIAGSRPIVRRFLPNACGSLRSRRAANRNGKAEKSGVAHRIPMGSWRLYGGFGLVVSGSTIAVLYGAVHPIPACFLPWAGFFWAKLFFWKSLLKP